MTDPEAARIIDKLLTAFFYGDGKAATEETVAAGLEYLMRTRRQYPDFIITFSIWDEMARRGLTT